MISSAGKNIDKYENIVKIDYNLVSITVKMTLF